MLLLWPLWFPIYQAAKAESGKVEEGLKKFYRRDTESSPSEAKEKEAEQKDER